jgi:hypothetical protein
MNDLNSILIATTVLAIGGLGFYMYKSEQGDFNDESEFYEHDFDNLEEDMEDEDEDDFSSSSSEDEELDEEKEDDSKRKNKTRRNSNGNSKTKKKRN